MKHDHHHNPDRIHRFHHWSLKAALLGLAVLLLSFDLSAQSCTLACNGSPEFPLEVSVNASSCTVQVTSDLILEAPQLCPGNKQLTVRDTLNNLIVEGVEIVEFDASALVSQLLSVTVTHLETGILCVGFIRLDDNIPPTLLNCEELTLTCLEATDPDSVGYPTVMDNCDSAPSLVFSDVFVAADCLTDTAGIITRTWTATDGIGNTTTCVQDINILRATAMDVSFPADVTLSCDNPLADPSITGVPELMDMPLMNGDLCGLAVGYFDDTTYICNNYMYQIERTWTVTEECTNFFGEESQIILIADETGPEITCPEPSELIFGTESSECGASLELPQISGTDNCGSEITFEVNTSFGTVGYGPFSMVPVGSHTVQYQATDECGNTSLCSTTLTVVDDSSPIAICEDQVIVSIAGQGISVLPAHTFDNGSYDNCAPEVFFKVKRDFPGACDQVNGDDDPDTAGSQEWFDDHVILCCEDISTGAVMVTLRVYEADPGSGAVDPNREENGGELEGHYSNCPVLITLQDAQAPAFASCPSPLTINCDEEQNNLSVYGHPVVVDNCSFTVDSTFTTTLNDCGTGTILRSWTATDPSGNSSSCSQLITVENNNMLPEDQIIWPEDYTTYTCGAGTDINDLPVESQQPIINWDGCGTIGVSHEDFFYDIAAPACYKILRVWTIIDWCHYNPDLPGSPGEFVYTQEIKVKDNSVPVVNCPSDITATVGNDCQTAYVNVPPVTATDCSTDLIITNDSPYAIANGADASGNYPVATTTVTYTVSDRCGNVSICEVDITVEDDQAPSVVCIVGLSTSISLTDDELVAQITADAFVNNATDNCDPFEAITYSIRKADTGEGAPTTTSLTFDCSEVGTQVVEVWATDSNGNSDFCLTVIAIQDNQGYCPVVNTSGMIAGAVITEEGDEVENVEISVSGGMSINNMTSFDGAFMFEDLPLGGDYSILAHRDEDMLNGVSTLDLVYMAKHVLGTELLDSPYKIIAADVDRSGHVSTLDIIKLRKLILMVEDELPNNNTSWRFIDASYTFPDPTNPFVTYFPEVYNVNNLDDDMMYADFVAVKVGDVNGSAVSNSFQGDDTQNRSNENDLAIQVPNEEVMAGDVIDIPFYGSYMTEYMGYQFTLEFDPNALAVQEIIPGDLPNLYPEENFNLQFLDQGLIPTIWNEYDETAWGEDTKLFTLRCRVLQTGELKEWLYLSSRMTTAESYTQDGTGAGVNLSVISVETESTTQFELFQNRPNPWKDETIIPFQLDPGGQASLTVYDMAGKQVYFTANEYSAGYHEIGISRNDLPTTGLFYYTLESGDQRATRKMVLTD